MSYLKSSDKITLTREISPDGVCEIFGPERYERIQCAIPEDSCADYELNAVLNQHDVVVMRGQTKHCFRMLDNGSYNGFYSEITDPAKRIDITRKCNSAIQREINDQTTSVSICEFSWCSPQMLGQMSRTYKFFPDQPVITDAGFFALYGKNLYYYPGVQNMIARFSFKLVGGTEITIYLRSSSHFQLIKKRIPESGYAAELLSSEKPVYRHTLGASFSTEKLVKSGAFTITTPAENTYDLYVCHDEAESGILSAKNVATHSEPSVHQLYIVYKLQRVRVLTRKVESVTQTPIRIQCDPETYETIGYQRLFETDGAKSFEWPLPDGKTMTASFELMHQFPADVICSVPVNHRYLIPCSALLQQYSEMELRMQPRDWISCDGEFVRITPRVKNFEDAVVFDIVNGVEVCSQVQLKVHTFNNIKTTAKRELVCTHGSNAVQLKGPLSCVMYGDDLAYYCGKETYEYELIHEGLVSASTSSFALQIGSLCPADFDKIKLRYTDGEIQRLELAVNYPPVSDSFIVQAGAELTVDIFDNDSRVSGAAAPKKKVSSATDEAGEFLALGQIIEVSGFGKLKIRENGQISLTVVPNRTQERLVINCLLSSGEANPVTFQSVPNYQVIPEVKAFALAEVGTKNMYVCVDGAINNRRHSGVGAAALVASGERPSVTSYTFKGRQYAADQSCFYNGLYLRVSKSGKIEFYARESSKDFDGITFKVSYSDGSVTEYFEETETKLPSIYIGCLATKPVSEHQLSFPIDEWKFESQWYYRNAGTELDDAGIRCRLEGRTLHVNRGETTCPFSISYKTLDKIGVIYFNVYSKEVVIKSKLSDVQRHSAGIRCASFSAVNKDGSQCTSTVGCVVETDLGIFSVNTEGVISYILLEESLAAKVFIVDLGVRIHAVSLYGKAYEGERLGSSAVLVDSPESSVIEGSFDAGTPRSDVAGAARGIVGDFGNLLSVAAETLHAAAEIAHAIDGAASASAQLFAPFLGSRAAPVASQKTSDGPVHINSDSLVLSSLFNQPVRGAKVIQLGQQTYYRFSGTRRNIIAATKVLTYAPVRAALRSKILLVDRNSSVDGLAAFYMDGAGKLVPSISTNQGIYRAYDEISAGVFSVSSVIQLRLEEVRASAPIQFKYSSAPYTAPNITSKMEYTYLSSSAQGNQVTAVFSYEANSLKVTTPVVYTCEIRPDPAPISSDENSESKQQIIIAPNVAFNINQAFRLCGSVGAYCSQMPANVKQDANRNYIFKSAEVGTFVVQISYLSLSKKFSVVVKN